MTGSQKMLRGICAWLLLPVCPTVLHDKIEVAFSWKQATPKESQPLVTWVSIFYVIDSQGFQLTLEFINFFFFLLNVHAICSFKVIILAKLGSQPVCVQHEYVHKCILTLASFNNWQLSFKKKEKKPEEVALPSFYCPYLIKWKVW